VARPARAAFFPSSPWAWALALGLASLILVAAKPYVIGKPKPDPFLLKASDRNGRMEIHWDPNLEVVKSAQSAVLDVLDGSDVRRYPVDAKVLRSGALDYLRNADEATVGLVLIRDGHAIGQAAIQSVAPVTEQVAAERSSPAVAKSRRSRRRLP